MSLLASDIFAGFARDLVLFICVIDLASTFQLRVVNNLEAILEDNWTSIAIMLL